LPARLPFQWGVQEWQVRVRRVVCPGAGPRLRQGQLSVQPSRPVMQRPWHLQPGCRHLRVPRRVVGCRLRQHAATLSALAVTATLAAAPTVSASLSAAAITAATLTTSTFSATPVAPAAPAALASATATAAAATLSSTALAAALSSTALAALAATPSAQLPRRPRRQSLRVFGPRGVPARRPMRMLAQLAGRGLRSLRVQRRWRADLQLLSRPRLLRSRRVRLRVGIRRARMPIRRPLPKLLLPARPLRWRCCGGWTPERRVCLQR
jgi:hypothetical protein